MFLLNDSYVHTHPEAPEQSTNILAELKCGCWMDLDECCTKNGSHSKGTHRSCVKAKVTEEMGLSFQGVNVLPGYIPSNAARRNRSTAVCVCGGGATTACSCCPPLP